jgi:hypothetical protein
VQNYIEPFGGSLAMLLGRPQPFGSSEIVNDVNGWLQNVWRAIQADPDAVAEYADNPVMELDLHARGDAIFYRGWTTAMGEKITPKEFIERMRADETWYDPKCAGWWIWGLSSWIGDNWGRENCRALPCLSDAGKGVNRQLPRLGNAGKGVNRQLPRLGNAGQGVNRQLPRLGNAGQGVNRQLPHLGDAGRGVNRQLPRLGNAGRGDENTPPSVTSRRYMLIEYMRQLAERLRMVRVCCGDWSRVCTDCVVGIWQPTAIFFDPPYAVADRDSVYGDNDDFEVAHAVRDYCIEHGENKQLRICLAGYKEHNELVQHGWEAVSWKTNSGYSNAKREVLWFSPHCLKPQKEKRLF